MEKATHGANLPTLSFNETPLRIIDHGGAQWLTGPDIARGLGYKDPDYIRRVYDRHSDEFTGDMSTPVKLTGVDGTNRITRIFSRRGAHLLAMFAKTPKAASFRKWVLDVLEDQNSPANVQNA